MQITSSAPSDYLIHRWLPLMRRYQVKINRHKSADVFRTSSSCCEPDSKNQMDTGLLISQRLRSVQAAQGCDDSSWPICRAEPPWAVLVYEDRIRPFVQSVLLRALASLPVSPPRLPHLFANLFRIGHDILCRNCHNRFPPSSPHWPRPVHAVGFFTP